MNATQVGRFAGSLVMAWTITSLMVHLPIAMIFGLDSTVIHGVALPLDLAVIVVMTREFYRNYEEWFEPL